MADDPRQPASALAAPAPTPDATSNEKKPTSSPLLKQQQQQQQQQPTEGAAAGRPISWNLSSASQMDEKEADRLGRMRPPIFKNTFVEAGFCAAILLAMIMAEFLISGFNVVLPNLMVDLNFGPEQKTWPSSVFSLVTGAFLLPFARLSDAKFGGFAVFLFGNAWMGVWTLAAGFANQLASWHWFFWVGAIMLALVCVMTFICVPAEAKGAPVAIDDETGQEVPHPPMDWLGCATSIPGLMLLVYAITDSPYQAGASWRSPQILVTFILGVLLLAGFVYVEGWVATAPLVPPSIFKAKHIVALFLCMFVSFGAFGIYLLYASFYIETILHTPPLLAAAWFAPLAVGGLTIALLGGAFLHKIPGTILMLISTLGFLVSAMLFYFIPVRNANYWAWVFPAMVSATIGIDIMYNVANIFITTSVRSDQQGLAGAIINGLVFLGMSFFLGWAELASALNSSDAPDNALRVSFLLGCGCAGFSILLVIFGIRIPKATGGLTTDEKERLARQHAGSGSGSTPTPEHALVSDNSSGTPQPKV
ncbi:hypothetical protein MAPG_09416 [Magnaporthiopsis poae ATCC 64411]|uniref:Major facilitator superfamily (MFS) profile domain-containing protein n=1 Tax=Magnaporthiopsis poae (strain ATCC 64411 / 73-15) TaxID=644358 RepID=A0A0C4E9W6_MAGP6|nr:hypothetical protein MAPG_09416 [Magnaporthiopsis poae ATCC 64411]